jgi:hypothetical protein
VVEGDRLGLDGIEDLQLERFVQSLDAHPSLLATHLLTPLGCDQAECAESEKDRASDNDSVHFERIDVRARD